MVAATAALPEGRNEASSSSPGSSSPSSSSSPSRSPSAARAQRVRARRLLPSSPRSSGPSRAVPGLGGRLEPLRLPPPRRGPEPGPAGRALPSPPGEHRSSEDQLLSGRTPRTSREGWPGLQGESSSSRPSSASTRRTPTARSSSTGEPGRGPAEHGRRRPDREPRRPDDRAGRARARPRSSSSPTTTAVSASVPGRAVLGILTGNAEAGRAGFAYVLATDEAAGREARSS